MIHDAHPTRLPSTADRIRFDAASPLRRRYLLLAVVAPIHSAVYKYGARSPEGSGEEFRGEDRDVVEGLVGEEQVSCWTGILLVTRETRAASTIHIGTRPPC